MLYNQGEHWLPLAFWIRGKQILPDLPVLISFFWRNYSNNVKAKIRQQLQFLRDKGVLDFVGRGQYRMKLKREINHAEICCQPIRWKCVCGH